MRFRVNQGFFPITISDDVIHGKRFRLERFWVNQFLPVFSDEAVYVKGFRLESFRVNKFLPVFSDEAIHVLLVYSIARIQKCRDEK